MTEFPYLSFSLSVLLACGQPGNLRMMSWQEGQDPGLLGPKIEVKSVKTSSWAVKDSKGAVERAERVLGIARGAYPATAELITLLDDDTPYLVQYLLEKPIWQVVLRDWTLTLASAQPETRDPYVRVFDVLVRPEDGRVLKIRSRWPKEEPPLPPEPGAVSATCQIYGSGFVVYHGFPETDPRVSFLEALDLLQKRGHDILTAKQISARYVVWSNIRYETPRPVWAITIRGVMPVRLLPRMPIEPKYEYRLTVDAETGKFLSGSNRPIPDEVLQSVRGAEGQ